MNAQQTSFRAATGTVHAVRQTAMASNGWRVVLVCSTPVHAGSEVLADTAPVTCQRCAAKLAKIVAADHDAAIDEDIRRVLGSLAGDVLADIEAAPAEDDGAPAGIADFVAPLPDTFAAGQRVGIVRGVQGVNGPQIYRYGTVVRSVELWMWIGTVEYVVRHDDDGAELVYAAYLLRPAPETANTIGHRATHASRVGAPLPRIRFADGRERQVRDARFGPTHTVLVYAEPHPSSDVFRHDAMITVI